MHDLPGGTWCFLSCSSTVSSWISPCLFWTYNLSVSSLDLWPEGHTAGRYLSWSQRCNIGASAVTSFLQVLTAEQQLLAANNDYNFDHPDAFDFGLLVHTLRKLKQGKSVKIPVYDFTTHGRQKEWVSGNTQSMESWSSVNTYQMNLTCGFDVPHFSTLICLKCHVYVNDQCWGSCLEAGFWFKMAPLR